MGRARQTSGQLNGPPPVPCEWTVRIDGHDYEVTLGEGHAMVDQHRLEGTCDWMPGMRTATASGNGRTLGLKVARRGSTG
jgi:propionyl-CoA carboxylase alpha chain